MKCIYISLLILALQACRTPKIVGKEERASLPVAYANKTDTTNSAQLQWSQYFTDSNLISLIDTALLNNQELNIMLQEVRVSNNEIRAKKGEYLPFLNIGGSSGLDKVGRHTRNGALEANNDIASGKRFPDPYTEMRIGAFASWELDIWKKLRNAKKSAVYKYLSTVEGKNFMVTKLISEIAHEYYELMALDNQLMILKSNIKIQQRALKIIILQKKAGEVTELAVKKFQAEVLKNKSRVFEIEQEIIATENNVNFLVGRTPQAIQRSSLQFNDLLPHVVNEGVPTQLLANRPDIRKAELLLAASKFDVKSAKANFYPSLSIRAGLGFEAFNPSHLTMLPESVLYGLAGELMGPVINRNAIKATYLNANAKQIQAVYSYEKAVLNAYVDVSTQLSNINNLQKRYLLKTQEVDVLNKSVGISTDLFKSARAEYMEVLLTQRDALNAKLELVETKKHQLNATVKIYQALGGGWK